MNLAVFALKLWTHLLVLHGSCDEVTACKRLLDKVDLKGYQVLD